MNMRMMLHYLINGSVFEEENYIRSMLCSGGKNFWELKSGLNFSFSILCVFYAPGEFEKSTTAHPGFTSVGLHLQTN